MKKIKRLFKWFFISFCILIVIGSLAGWLYIKSEKKKLFGENTLVVDTSQFNVLNGKLAISNVAVLSKQMDSMIPNQLVLIDNDHIEYVGNQKVISTDYTNINAQGKYLIPGLVDTHVHPYKSRNDLLLYIANGITHIAIMNSQKGLYLKWREEAKKGALIPQIYVAAGPMNTAHDTRSEIYGLLGPIPNFNDPLETKNAVKGFKQAGYDAVKVYNLNKSNYLAVSEEAEKQSIPMIGHITDVVSLEDLLKGNQSQVAHVEEITKAMEREFGGRSKIYYNNTESYITFLKKHADSIAKRLKEKKIVVSTTIDIYPRAKEQDLNLKEYLKSIQLEYLNPGILEGSVFNPGWLPGSNRYEDPWNTDAEGLKKAEIFWDTYTEAVNIMTNALIRNNVHVTVGTDAGNPGIIPGFSIHDELEQLHAIGIDKKTILKAATKTAAEWVGSNAGVIEKGRPADLVLLDADPLKNISNTRKIHGIVLRGKYINRNQLDAILKSIKYANQQSRKINIDEYISD